MLRELAEVYAAIAAVSLAGWLFRIAVFGDGNENLRRVRTAVSGRERRRSHDED